jgi:hypothetical protein
VFFFFWLNTLLVPNVFILQSIFVIYVNEIFRNIPKVVLKNQILVSYFAPTNFHYKKKKEKKKKKGNTTQTLAILSLDCLRMYDKTRI